MNILVTGGTGYIGSHTLIELDKEDTIVVVDNLSNSKVDVLDRINLISKRNIKFYQYDVNDIDKVENLFEKYKFDAVIHFAGFKAVGESVEKPLDYYYNNVLSTINISKLCIKYEVNKFIFSSSATVYGEQQSPLTEDMELKKTANPYGETKAMCERILIDTANANSNFCVTLLRYFNPLGAHRSGLIGENPKGVPNNLMPYVTKVAKGELKELNVFGNDYDTPDGTGVRDYIHVVDLAKGHVAALNNMRTGISIYNLGTGKGTSVLELIETFERVNSIKIPYRFKSRRSGDLAIVYADSSKANNELFWSANLSLGDMCKDSWNFEKNNN